MNIVRIIRVQGEKERMKDNGREYGRNAKGHVDMNEREVIARDREGRFA